MIGSILSYSTAQQCPDRVCLVAHGHRWLSWWLSTSLSFQRWILANVYTYPLVIMVSEMICIEMGRTLKKLRTVMLGDSLQVLMKWQSVKKKGKM